MEKFNIQNPEEQNSSPQESGTRQEREKIWRDKALAVEQITDKLGLEIDKGIKDTVIALQVLGINTTSSHEGKIDIYPIPYIDIESTGIESIKEKLKLLRPDQEAESEVLEDEIMRRNLEERKKIIPYLEEFYRGRDVSYEARLGIQSLARGWSRIQSQGADFQKVETDEKLKEERLKEFQQEMKAFTEFLKGKFFENL
jgi:hypothetical protein